MTTVGEWLQHATHVLTEAHIPTARLDALLFIEDILKAERAHILAHLDEELSSKQIKQLGSLLDRRKAHEPVAYIRGRTEFYGRSFQVDTHVLEPRPETETMIDILKTLTLPADCVVVDIGTGSGAIAITVKLEYPPFEVIAIDIDPQCLTVAKKNAKSHAVSIQLIEGNLAAPLSDLPALSHPSAIIILANLPYVPDSFHINPAAMREPRHAIFGGVDGLDLYRTMFQQIASLPVQPSYVITESLPPQHPTLTNIARTAGFSLQTDRDFIQCFTSL